MSFIDFHELTDIILQMKNGDQPQYQIPLPNYKTPLLMLEKVSRSNRKSIEKTIDLLRDDSNNRNVQLIDYQPYNSIILSYLHCILDNHEQSLRYAQSAVEQFHRSPDHWDRAMAHWFLGIVYKINEVYDESKIELENAIALLEEHSIVASRKYSHETSRLCHGHIGKIKESIKRLQNQKTHLPPTSKITAIIKEFSGIIGNLVIPLELDYLDGLKDDAINLDATSLVSIKSLITRIYDDLMPQILEPSIESAIINIILSHCYNIGYYIGWKHIQEAETCIVEAINQFRSQHDYYNQAISHWYLSLLYQNFSNPKNALFHLNEADSLLESLTEEYQDTNFYLEIQNRRRDIQDWISLINNQQGRPAQKLSQEYKKEKSEKEKKPLSNRLKPNSQHLPDFTQFRKNESNIRRVHLSSDGGESKPPGKGEPPKGNGKLPPKNNSKPTVKHIIIPVDFQALQDEDPELETLDDGLFEKLHQYDEKITAHNGQKTVKLTQRITHHRQVTIPRYPLYGQVAAGPNGEPSLDTPIGMVEAIKDETFIQIEGQKCEVLFIHNEQFNFKNDGSYGWLKVIGQSMNNSDPIKINDGDYVLFSENRVVSQCTHRIVVAGLFETDYEFRLVVKRLLKDEKSPSERPEYVLHSESSLHRDPQTGSSYKQDIKISNNNRLVGEIIAIAKPT